MFVSKTGHEGGVLTPLSLVARHIELAPPLRQTLNGALGGKAPVSMLLSHEAVAVTRGTSVESVASFMQQMKLNTLPVVDGAGQLLGVVSTRDLLGEARDQRDAVEQAALLQAHERDALDDGFHGTSLSSACVGDVMTASTLALTDSTSVARAAQTMVREGLSEVPVVCEQCGGFCIVSALDVLVWLSKSHGEPR